MNLSFIQQLLVYKLLNNVLQVLCEQTKEQSEKNNKKNLNQQQKATH